MRRLLVFSLAFAAATVYAIYRLSSDIPYTVCVLLALSALILFFFGKKSRCAEILGIIIAGTVCAIISFCIFCGHTAQQCRPLHGMDAEMTAEAESFCESGDGYKRVYARLTGDNLPNVRTVIYSADGDDAFEGLEPGDIFSFNGRIRSSDIRYGSRYNNYYASGIFLIATAKENISVEKRDTSLLKLIRYFPVRLNRLLSGRIDSLYSGRVSMFMKSLMINDRSDFYSDDALSQVMSRAGIMHVIAVSGMHLAFIVGFFRILFGNSRRMSLLCILIIWVFVITVGAVPSAVRAGFMQTLLLIAPVLKKENDTPTSLGFALLILLLINPYSIQSISLQLSFAAVAGLLVFSVPLYSSLRTKKNRISLPLDYIISVALCSVGVMIFIVPVTAYHFGSVNILSVITNILVIWAVPICFGGGFLSLALSPFLPSAARVTAAVVSFIVRYIIGAAERISAIPYSTLYLNNSDGSAVYWLIIVIVVFAVFRFLDIPARFKVIVPALISFVLLGVMICASKLYYEAYPVFSAIDVGQGQCLTVFSSKSTVMIDCGSVMTPQNAGDVAGQYLLSCGRDKVDLLVLTHLHEDHSNGVARLLNYIPVGEIIISDDVTDDGEQLEEVLSAAYSHGVTVKTVSSTFYEDAGDIHLYCCKSLFEKHSDQNEKCLFCIASVGDYDMLVTADASAEMESELVESNCLPNIELLIAGHHGSKYSSGEKLLGFCSGADCIISTGYNTYGHPAEESLQRLSKYMNSIYRTDIDGTVQIVLRGGGTQ